MVPISMRLIFSMGRRLESRSRGATRETLSRTSRVSDRLFASSPCSHHIQYRGAPTLATTYSLRADHPLDDYLQRALKEGVQGGRYHIRPFGNHTMMVSLTADETAALETRQQELKEHYASRSADDAVSQEQSCPEGS